MFQDHLTVRLRHERFIRTICKEGIVFSLESEEGFATSSSNELDDEDGNVVPIVCFWSEKALANSCKKDAWENYRLVEISLSEFVEDWCVGLYNDEILAGTNFDSRMFGYETDPLDLILELIEELKANQIEIELRKYKDIRDLENQVREITEE